MLGSLSDRAEELVTARLLALDNTMAPSASALNVTDKTDQELLDWMLTHRVHLLMDCHPALNLSRLIGNLKTVSARHIRKENTEYLTQFFWKPLFWSRAYAVTTTGGANLETVKQYVLSQEKPRA